MPNQVEPTVQLGQYKKLPVMKRAIQPTEKQVDEALRALRYKESVWKDETGPAQRRDQALLDFEGFFSEGIPIPDSKAEGVIVTLGQGKMLPGVEDAICGHCAGESFRIPVTYPEEFPLKSLARRKVEFSITLHRVKRRCMPNADDAFAQARGCETMAELREKLKQQELEKNRSVENRRIETLLLAQAGAAMQVEFPEGYLEEKAEQRVRAMEQDLIAAGQQPSLYYRLTGHDRAWYLQHAALEIEVDWRRRLAVQEIAKAEQLTVSDAEIDAELARVAQGKANVKALKRETVETALLTRKVQQVLVSNAVYTE